MAKRNGKDGAMTLGGTAIACLREWSYEETDEDVVSTCMGDDWVDRDSLRGDFTVEFTSILEIASPYVFPSTLRGTKSAFVLKVVDTDTNGLITGNGKVKRLRIVQAYDEVVLISGTIECAGTGVTWDLSPAT